MIALIGGIIGLFFSLVFGLLGLLAFIIWLWLLIHAIKNKGLSDGEKICWVLAIIFLPVIGPVLYFFIGRPKG